MANLREKQPVTFYGEKSGGNPGGSDLSRRLPFNRKEARIPFALLLFYLLLEYGRPQDQVPILSSLHLPAITIVLLLIAVFLSGKFRLREKQTILFLGLLGLMVVHGPIAVNNYWALMIFITMAINFIVFLSLISKNSG